MFRRRATLLAIGLMIALGDGCSYRRGYGGDGGPSGNGG
jgi:hypothetical protein